MSKLKTSFQAMHHRPSRRRPFVVYTAGPSSATAETAEHLIIFAYLAARRVPLTLNRRTPGLWPGESAAPLQPRRVLLRSGRCYRRRSSSPCYGDLTLRVRRYRVSASSSPVLRRRLSAAGANRGLFVNNREVFAYIRIAINNRDPNQRCICIYSDRN
jgi:hypothetical protein